MPDPVAIPQVFWDLVLHGALHAFIVGAFVWIIIAATRGFISSVLKRPLWHKTPVGRWVIRLLLQPGLGALLLSLHALTGTYPWGGTSWVIPVAVGAFAGVQAELWHQWLGKLFERFLGRSGPENHPPGQVQ